MLYRPTAPQALVDGYRTAAGLASTRQQECERQGDEREAQVWGNLAEYCRRMAQMRAINDDQYQCLKFGMHHNKRVSAKSKEQMEAIEEEQGVLPVIDTANPGVADWKLDYMEEALKILTPYQRICFEMHHAGGLEYREIGEALEMSRGQVLRLVQRARKKLARGTAELAEAFMKKCRRIQ